MKYFLPCHIPDPIKNPLDHKDKVSSIETNIAYIKRCDPSAEISIYNNGAKITSINNVGVFYSSGGDFSANPSTGEALMLRDFLSRNNGVFIKLHARCMINNLPYFINTKEENIFFLRRNVLSNITQTTINELPYVDTRTFKAKSEELADVFHYAIEKTIEGGVNIEQALLYAFMKFPAKCGALKTHSPNFPIYFGRAGHGKNYSSFSSQTSQRLKALLYRLGLS